jgi:hypothetical protein
LLFCDTHAVRGGFDFIQAAMTRIAVSSRRPQSNVWPAALRPALAETTVHRSLKEVEAILDAHYLGRDIRLAEAAVPKPERGQNCKMNANHGARSRRLNRQLLEMLGGGSSRAKPVSKSRTGNFLKIPGQNRLSRR